VIDEAAAKGNVIALLFYLTFIDENRLFSIGGRDRLPCHGPGYEEVNHGKKS
jgi:hypothetical protein